MTAGAPRFRERVEAVAAELRSRELDGLLVSAPANVRYLTGFTGSNSLALILAHGSNAAAGAEHLFLTDFRYITQAAAEVAECFIRWPDSAASAQSDLLGAAAEQLARIDGRRLGFEADHLTVSRHEHLDRLLPPAWELVASSGVVERLREVKDESEIERIAAASQLADDALRRVLEGGLVGRSERDVALQVEFEMRRLGAEAESFPSIVAAGTHGALPHAQPRDVEIAPGQLVTIDWGATLDGYCSDCTRTFATGRPSDHAREVYELVLRAQETALAGLRSGMTGKEADGLAREVIEQAGQGEHFGHGLGHGVGIEVHEQPRLSRSGGEATLRAGTVVTVEPGVYLPGELGVRIEDLVVLGDDGNRNLSSLPKSLAEVA
jgi:Xaa-Pro aminopeptidase